ncbi:methyltransferase [Parachryseolinea silvisoli]|jgi:ubiquinone/menaquinone biosynthesis C-methylase UbiE|uniref:methyltransferase n=1 Tax=Parachryseolinea silvisoli TaxID=2873601 RepID=UPI002265E7AC|nr:class I SAM-dependent methyltransferase [Parachryseolinea silvisoli]MCD9014569.1 class I SAM-dependent methyltransferase [Parachryseolinea silvisoli]
MNFFETDKLTALQAIEKAQWIAFAPVVFQATRVLRDTGILQAIEDSADGMTQDEVVARVQLPVYGVRVLLEAGLGIGLVTFRDGRYRTTKTTSFILHDTLTRVNMDFTHDVCYNAMFFLEESIREERPAGLQVLGNWSTIYEGLSKLPPKAKKSWFAFDHFYSDFAFPEVQATVFQHQPKTLLDIGGNTGKWATACFEYDPNVTVTIMDLPGQVEMARTNIAAKGFADRVRFQEANILDEQQQIAGQFDVIWMSQFLDCFSEDQIRSILRRCRQALSPTGKVFILEPFWNNQRFQASAFSLQQTSLYFTAIANGNSQMYHSGIFTRCIEDAGFRVTTHENLIGVSHTLLTCEAV